MKRLAYLMVAALLAMSVMLCGCSEEVDTTPTATATESTAAEIIIDEAGAKEIALADACIPETAAENLTVELEGNSYIVSFQWSGFDYQYTVNGTNGEITEELFDGEPV